MKLIKQMRCLNFRNILMDCKDIKVGKKYLSKMKNYWTNKEELYLEIDNTEEITSWNVVEIILALYILFPEKYDEAKKEKIAIGLKELEQSYNEDEVILAEYLLASLEVIMGLPEEALVILFMNGR